MSFGGGHRISFSRPRRGKAKDPHSRRRLLKTIAGASTPPPPQTAFRKVGDVLVRREANVFFLFFSALSNIKLREPERSEGFFLRRSEGFYWRVAPRFRWMDKNPVGHQVVSPTAGSAIPGAEIDLAHPLYDSIASSRTTVSLLFLSHVQLVGGETGSQRPNHSPLRIKIRNHARRPARIGSSLSESSPKREKFSSSVDSFQFHVPFQQRTPFGPLIFWGVPLWGLLFSKPKEHRNRFWGPRF